MSHSTDHPDAAPPSSRSCIAALLLAVIMNSSAVPAPAQTPAAVAGDPDELIGGSLALDDIVTDADARWTIP